MYTVYVDNWLLYDSRLPDYTMIDPVLSLKANEPGQLTFVLPKTNPNINELTRLKSRVKVYRDNILIFLGRLIEDKVGIKNTTNYVVEGALAFLLDSVQRPFTFDGTPAELFAFLLQRHNEQVNIEQQIGIGNCNVTTADSIVVTTEEYLSTWAVMKQYARVSTASDEQFTSYEAQIDYYTKYIQQRPDWQFVKVYTDEGISGTNTKKRDGFNEMIADALAGKIDLIVTKSVSRFARNTVDSLVTVRLLKEKGIEIYFEKENIYTLDSKGELLITLMSSLAQEESRSLSENVTWGQRKRFSDGKVNLPYKQFLGYRKGPNDLPEIVPEEAVTIRRIYKLFIEGKTTTGIARILTHEGVPTPAGKQNWRASTVESILRNEKYKGDALLQKAFTVDFLTKKQKKNEGEVPQYYVENSHPAIIAPDEWEAVQREFVRRKEIGRAYSGNTPLSTRLICDECGGYFGAKVWHSNDKYRKEIWQCNNKFKGNQNCTTPVVTEENVKERFMVAIGKMLNERDTVMENCRMIQKQLTDCTGIDEQIEALLQEIEIVVELTHRCINENASTAQDQATYTEKYSGLVDRYEKLNSRLEQLQHQKKKRLDKAEDIGYFMFKTLEAETIITEFDDRLWTAAIDCVRVCTDGRLVFKFKAGLEIEA